jgi:regulator of CtrA degradation
MLEQSQEGVGRDALALDFAGSALFERTFQEGMALVEQTAAYLDGEGRRESKRLGRSTALGLRRREHAPDDPADADRQLAAGQRAVREGRHGPPARPATSATGGRQSVCQGGETAGDLPAPLLDLLGRSEALYEPGPPPRPPHVPGRAVGLCPQPRAVAGRAPARRLQRLT